MSSVARPESAVDLRDIPFVVRASVKLAAIEAVLVLGIALVSRELEGPLETALLALLVTAGLFLVAFLPGLWTRARTLEGIAAAAGIGLAASWIFVVPDIAYQFAGVYTHRWRALGGGSNWWHLPVWWMAGTFLPWMGAWVLANQAARGRGQEVSLAGAAALVGVITAGLGTIAVVTGFPGAGWNVPTFGIASLPALALAVLVTGLGARRK
jgi:hypothetical protein